MPETAPPKYPQQCDTPSMCQWPECQCEEQASVSRTAAKQIAERDRIAATYRPGTFGCHEALHMASVARDFVEEHVCNHPTIGLNPEWEALANKACEALFDLYQAIGREHL